MPFDLLQALSDTSTHMQLFGRSMPQFVSPAFFMLVAIGFFAQLVDGAMGMAYGLTSSSLLLFFGVPPQAVSASVHAAEIATTGVSGISHSYFGNVDAKLVWKLAVPGVLGGVIGALLLAHVSSAWLKPLVAAYLLCLGAVLLKRAWHWQPSLQQRKTGPSLGLVAGFLDAVGGGGWGTMTTGSLIAKHHEPRIAIGSANAAEFFVTVAISAVLFATFGLAHLQLIAGLILGGVLAAPLAASLTRLIPARVAMTAVGSLVILLSVLNLGKGL